MAVTPDYIAIILDVGPSMRASGLLGPSIEAVKQIVMQKVRQRGAPPPPRWPRASARRRARATDAQHAPDNRTEGTHTHHRPALPRPGPLPPRR